MIGGFIAMIRAAGLEPAAEDLADAIWLAAQLPAPVAVAEPLPETEAESEVPRPNPDEAALREYLAGREKRRQDQQQEPQVPPATGAFLPDTAQNAEGAGVGTLAFRSPAATALPNALGIARALRPLKRSVPSRTITVLDEAATVDQIAEQGVWLTVERPAAERWLEIALVIDRSSSMAVWTPTIRELTHLLEHHGAFRNVQLWSLHTDALDGQVRLVRGFAESTPQSPTHDASVLIDPAARRLILLASDCVSVGWHDNRVAKMLAAWAAGSAFAIVQLLPERLWARSGLARAMPAKLYAPRPGVPNRALRATSTRRRGGGLPHKHTQVPVITLEPHTIRPWARMVAGAGGAWSPGYLFETATIAPVAAANPANPANPPSADLLVRGFEASASPHARQLAYYLAAAPLSLPVMRLVQRVMLPESDQVHLAEVFVSGLLRRAGPIGTAPDATLYDFQPGVRELLASRLRVSETMQVLNRVAAYLAHHGDLHGSFTALIADPTRPGNLRLGAASLPFAEIAAPLLRRLGGEYAALAERLEQSVEKEPGRAEPNMAEVVFTSEAEVVPADEAVQSATEAFDEQLESSAAQDYAAEGVEEATQAAANSEVPYVMYFDCDITIGEGRGTTYPVTLRSMAGEASAVMSFPFSALELENHLLMLQNTLLRWSRRLRTSLSPEIPAVVDFGRALFDALFTGDVRELYYSSLARAEQDRKGLRLRLRILAPELASLPWEFLYDSRQATFLVLSSQTPIVRHLELPDSIKPFQISTPLRILGMIANPNDQQQLDLENEKRRLETAVTVLQQRGQVELVWLEGQTWHDLQRAMQLGPWHVLHFIGHGGFDASMDEGVVLLANEHGDTNRLPASSLARLLADQESLRLAVLNSCDSDRGSETDVFASTAATLVRRGISAVLAMQFEMSDQAAANFSGTFYEALAEMLPVDAAVTEARKQISIATRDSIDWGVPVLYMRSTDGRLFDNTAGAMQLPPKISQPTPFVEASSSSSSSIEDTNKDSESDAAQLTILVPDFMATIENQSWDEAIRLGEQILSIDQNQADVRTKLAAAYDERSIESHTQKQYDQAIHDDSRAIDLDPGNAQYYKERGVSYHDQGNYAQAIADYSRAIELDPNQADYYFERGKSYDWIKNYAQAIADTSRAIELDPSVADYYLSRGIGYHHQGDYAQAIADNSHAIELDPNNANYYHSRGGSYYAQGNYASAIVDASRAIELEPDNGEHYYNRGLSYRASNDKGAARRDFQRAVELGYTKAEEELKKLGNWWDFILGG